ncbi:MAG: MarR family transcriptional regulator [Clostridia bacterium]|nr:MarR family transcriptional regulator [Clostridia bacterium]
MEQNRKDGDMKCKCRFSPTPPMLVNEISRLFQARMRQYDLSGVMSQDSARLMMRALSREDGVSQLHLTSVTHLKAPTVSVTLKKMEEEGLVRREQDKLDLRMTRVYLTERGKEHNRGVWDRLQELDATLMKNFTAEETEQMRKLLERMRDNILSSEKGKNTEN